MLRSHRFRIGLPLLLCAVGSCAAPAQNARAKPSSLDEQVRRRAAFDSVVRTVNTDSAYTLWQKMLTAQDIRAAQLAMMCEHYRINYRYGAAGRRALARMTDTLWRNADRGQVQAMEQRITGQSPQIGRNTCGTLELPAAPEWLLYEPPAVPKASAGSP